MQYRKKIRYNLDRKIHLQVDLYVIFVCSESSLGTKQVIKMATVMREL